MLGPTKTANQFAALLQRGSLDEGNTSMTDANPHAVAVATIHARQDLVLLYSMQTSCHDQLVIVSRGVWALVALAALAVLRHFL